MLMDPLVLKKKMNRYGNAGDLAVLSSLLCYITELAARASQDKSKLSTTSEDTSYKTNHNSKHLSTKDNSCSSNAKRPTKFQILQSRFMNPNRAPPMKRTREVGKLIFKEKQSVSRVSIGPKIYKLDRSKEKKDDSAEENKRATADDRVRWTHPSGKNTVKNILRKFMAAEEKEQEKPEAWKEKSSTKNLPKIISKNSMLSKLKEKFEQPSSLCSVTKLNPSLLPTKVKSRKNDPKIKHICKAEILELQDDTEAATGIAHPVSHHLACTEDSLPLVQAASFISYPLSMCNTVIEVSQAVSCSADIKRQTRNILGSSAVNKAYEGQENDMVKLSQTSQNYLIDDTKPGLPEMATVLGQTHNPDNNVTDSSDTCEANFINTVLPENKVVLVDDNRTSDKRLDILAASSGQSNPSNSADYQKSLEDMHGNVMLDISPEKQNITAKDNCIPMSVKGARDHVESAHEMFATNLPVCKATEQDVAVVEKTDFPEDTDSSNEMSKTNMADLEHKSQTKMTFDVPVTHNTSITNYYCPGEIEATAGKTEQENSTEVNRAQMIEGNINPVPKPTEPLTSERKIDLQANPSLGRSKFLGSDNKEPGISVQEGPFRTLPTTVVCDAPKVNDNCKGITGTEIDFTNQGQGSVPALVSSPASCDNSIPVHRSPATVRQKEEITGKGSVADYRSPHHGVDSSKTEILTNPPFLSTSLGTTAFPHMCMSQGEPGDTLPHNFIDQKIISVETVSGMIPSFSSIQAKASCNVETPIETAQTVAQTPMVQEEVLSAPGQDNRSCGKNKIPATLENGRVQSFHINNKPFTDSKTSDKVTTKPKDYDSTNENLPKSQLPTKSQITKRKADQMPIGQNKKDMVTMNTTTLLQDKKDKSTVRASPRQQDNKSTVDTASIQDNSDINTLNTTPLQDNNVDESTVKAAPLQTNNNPKSTVNTFPHQHNKSDMSTVNTTPLEGSKVDKSNMVKSPLQQEKINTTPTPQNICDRSTVYKTPEQKDKKDKSTKNETPQKQDKNHKDTVNETSKLQDKNRNSTANETSKQQDNNHKNTETPKKQDKNQMSTVSEIPKKQEKNQMSTVNETLKKQDKNQKSTVTETPKKQDKSHKSTVSETQKKQDKNHTITVNETPKLQDKSHKGTVNKTPMQPDKNHKSTLNETQKQPDKNHKSTLNETQKQPDKNHKSTLNETQKQPDKNHKSTANETAMKQDKRDTSTVNRANGKYRILPSEAAVQHNQAIAGASTPSLQSSSPQDGKLICKDSVARSRAAKYTAESYGEDNITRNKTFKPLVIRASDTFKRET